MGCPHSLVQAATCARPFRQCWMLSSGPYPARASTVGITADSVRFGICRKNAQTKAEIRPNKASPYNPPAKLPVQSFIKPTYHGPKKPPRLPSELIQEMPAAKT